MQMTLEFGRHERLEEVTVAAVGHYSTFMYSIKVGTTVGPVYYTAVCVCVCVCSGQTWPKEHAAVIK
jgi:hypothetical protein